jgi:[FeFe] hydrogenase (group B1/B3)
MRGLFTPITKIRRQVFTEVARFAYERDLSSSDYSYFYESSYRIIPGEQPQYRDSVFKERAIIRERIRMALGLAMRPVDRHHPMTEDMELADTSEKCLQEPLVEVIPFACEACPTDQFFVTNNCRKCLAHPCTSVCPVKAVTIGKRAAIIDTEKCIKCGRCVQACPYNAIVRFGRPCAEACGADAIESDSLNRAVINQQKCVACGLCIVSCPFAAIADKSEIFQLITAIRRGEPVYAEIAPSFVGQFGPLATPGKVVAALKKLGFKDVLEVGLGADIGSMHEAGEFLDNVPDSQEFLGTSCCPSWEAFAEAVQPELAGCISSSHTPMVATAQKIKKLDKNARVVFIGPCVAKKREGLEDEVRDYIDYVITFEELMGMFGACEIEWQDISEDNFTTLASRDGRNYAVAGQVAQAIASCISRLEPDRMVKTDNADTLRDCKKMLLKARAGQYKGYILEGMACPSGCVGGPGTLMPIPRAGAAVKKFAGESPYLIAMDNPALKE